MKERNGQNPDL